MKSWKIWIDTGGTFTDCLAIAPDGRHSRLKILSSGELRIPVVRLINDRTIETNYEWTADPSVFINFTVTFPVGREKRRIRHINGSIIELDQPLSAKKYTPFYHCNICSEEEVPIVACRILTGTKLEAGFPPIELRLGSTRGTNALLERKGAKTALIVTRGFRDILVIGDQQRRNLFSLHVQKSEPLYSYVIEADARIESDGRILKELTDEEVTRIVARITRSGCASVAVAFMNSYKNPAHEIRMEKALLAAGFAFVSCSHKLSGQIRFLRRTETSVVNAYLDPIINNYLADIARTLGVAGIKVMSSAGTLLEGNAFLAKDSLLSGPAGGVIGALAKAKQSGVNNIITFDMGGTSTDVSLCEGRPDHRYVSEVRAHRIFTPSLAIETIAAGGGSVCSFDGYRLTVGPESAGADPGPACYGAGGPLTITDVNLLLGRLVPQNFPIPIKKSDAERALQRIIKKIKQSGKFTYDREEVLISFIAIANEKMAEALKKVSVRNGHDPRDYGLVCFGGAGGQHACSLAGMLGINKILIPYDAGLLSAYGIGHARHERMMEKLFLADIEDALPEMRTAFDELVADGRKVLREEGYHEQEIRTGNKLVFLRLKGQETSLEVPFTSEQALLPDFKRKYRKVYGHWIANRAIEVETIRATVFVEIQDTGESNRRVNLYHPVPHSFQTVWMDSKWKQAAIYNWEQLESGVRIDGPAIVLSKNSTTLVESGWRFILDGNNTGKMQCTKIVGGPETVKSDEGKLELFTNRFTSIAQQMGALLERTAFSVNVKERLDFSCALLDRRGFLVVNAPHIPVHLGSLGVCVRSLAKTIKMEKGDVVVTNHPAYGGSHLPDVTLVKPVFYGKELIGYVANRAHHAEIGGKRPGSMPAGATRLEEEGVVIEPMYLIRSGKARWDNIEQKLTGGLFPSRNVTENLADLQAGLAALNLGEERLIELCKKYTGKQVRKFMEALIRYSSAQMKEVISRLPARRMKAKEFLDDGSPVAVSLQRSGKYKLIIDFSGSAPRHWGNLNATGAIVQSVVLYVLRLLMNKPLPLNEGLLKAVRIVLPKGLLNPSFRGNALPAVVGGNTEVSQRLTDTFLKALGLAACSQGTMNNFLFGNEQFGYYETICGGVGAGPGFDGADAVHQHMTNTRITDPEILEFRYPVRLEKFQLRKGSGGNGRWRGGNGVVRRFYFKAPLEVSILSQHRTIAPYGLHGGEEGKTGKQVLITPRGKKVLNAIDEAHVEPGDIIEINTPGGGGYGAQ